MVPNLTVFAAATSSSPGDMHFFLSLFDRFAAMSQYKRRESGINGQSEPWLSPAAPEQGALRYGRSRSHDNEREPQMPHAEQDFSCLRKYKREDVFTVQRVCAGHGLFADLKKVGQLRHVPDVRVSSLQIGPQQRGRHENQRRKPIGFHFHATPAVILSGAQEPHVLARA